MKFGKDFRNHLEETLPEWRDKFLRYKPLKKLIKGLPGDPGDVPPGVVGLEEWFVGILDEELDKFNDFYVDKEEEFVIRLQELKERIEKVKASRNGAFEPGNEHNADIIEIRKAFVTIHGEMVLLQNYSSLNFAGLVKILKKYDKRTGGLLSLPFTRRALHQPFFSTDPLRRLVRDCEDNLEILFPVEPEVVESTSQAKPEQKNEAVVGDPAGASTSGIREDAVDLYRSTLAALKAIQGLRRASSTYNPLSLAHFFHGVDGENASGAVTSDESSPSSAGSQGGDADQEVRANEASKQQDADNKVQQGEANSGA